EAARRGEPRSARRSSAAPRTADGADEREGPWPEVTRARQAPAERYLTLRSGGSGTVPSFRVSPPSMRLRKKRQHRKSGGRWRAQPGARFHTRSAIPPFRGAVGGETA